MSKNCHCEEILETVPARSLVMNEDELIIYLNKLNIEGK